MNVVVKRSFDTANIPCWLEPNGLFRSMANSRIVWTHEWVVVNLCGIKYAQMTMLHTIWFWLVLTLVVWPLKPRTKHDKVEILGLCVHFGASSHWDVWSFRWLQTLFTDRGNELWTSWRTQAYSFLLQCMAIDVQWDNAEVRSFSALHYKCPCHLASSLLALVVGVLALAPLFSVLSPLPTYRTTPSDISAPSTHFPWLTLPSLLIFLSFPPHNDTTLSPLDTSASNVSLITSSGPLTSLPYSNSKGENPVVSWGTSM